MHAIEKFNVFTIHAGNMNVERGEVLKRRTQCNNNYNRDDGVKGAQESFLQAELAIVGNIIPEAHLKDIDDAYDINVRV